MGRTSTPSEPLMLIAALLAAALMIWMLNLLPKPMLDLLTLWILVSIPVGMVFGHCALSED